MVTFPVDSVVVTRRYNNNMSSQAPPSKDGEELSELGGSSASRSSFAVVVTPGVMSLDVITHVWDFDRIEKRGGPDLASRHWFCGWCNSTFNGGWNATKAMNHCARLAGNNDVKACTGPIPRETLAVFRGFRIKKIGKKAVKRRQEEALQNSLSENQQSMSVAWEQDKVRNSASSGTTNEVVDLSADTTDVAVSNSTKLTTAIAEYVYCKGLSFSAVEGEEFQRVLKLSRLVPMAYRPPHRKLLSNDLLDLSYKTRIAKYTADLDVDAEVYGLSLFGDGATVHGMPLMNILASGVGEPCAVLSIVDCKFSFVFVFVLIFYPTN